MRYSNSKKQFFPKGVNYSSLPDDIIDVSIEEASAALNRQPGETLDLVDGHVVVVPVPAKTISELRTEKSRTIESACRASILSGTNHDALGAVHAYPTGETDQINLNGLISKSLIEGEAGEPYKFWCADANDIWDRRGHTAAQIKSVGLAVAAHVIAQQDKYALKLADIDAAQTQQELNLIEW